MIEKGGKGGKGGGKNPWQEGSGKKGGKGREKVGKEKSERVRRAARQDTLQLGAGKEETKTCIP